MPAKNSTSPVSFEADEDDDDDDDDDVDEAVAAGLLNVNKDDLTDLSSSSATIALLKFKISVALDTRELTNRMSL